MFDVFVFILLLIGHVCMLRGTVLLWRRNQLADREHAAGLAVTSALMLLFGGAVIARLCGVEV